MRPIDSIAVLGTPGGEKPCSCFCACTCACPWDMSLDDNFSFPITDRNLDFEYVVYNP